MERKRKRTPWTPEQKAKARAEWVARETITDGFAERMRPLMGERVTLTADECAQDLNEHKVPFQNGSIGWWYSARVDRLRDKLGLPLNKT